MFLNKIRLNLSKFFQYLQRFLNYIIFLILLSASNTIAAEPCFPKQVRIQSSELIDQVTSLSITSYTLQTEYSEECLSHQSPYPTEVLIATLKKGSLKTSINTQKKGQLLSGLNSQWNIRINTSYFDKTGKPTLFLKSKDKNLGEKLSRRGGVFYCVKGACKLVPSSSYKVSKRHEIALQSTPRLIQSGKYIKGLRNPNVLDQRIGLAINKNGDTLIFQSRRANFNELRRFLLTELNVKHAIALDGGSSTSFHSLSADEDGKTHEVDMAHYFWANVPYYINFSDSN